MPPLEILRQVWRWEAPHPEWSPEDAEGGGWERVVASYLVDRPGEAVLVDPLVEAEAWPFLDDAIERAGGRPHVLLTIFWHARSTSEVARRYAGARVWAHEPAADLVRERAPVTDTFTAGERLPGGLEAIEAGRAYEVLFWLPDARALVAGDVLLGGGGGVRLCPESWLGPLDPVEFRTSLRKRLRGLPVEHLLLTHGDTVLNDGRAALDQALEG